ncbi:MAG: hypothetical protein K6U02_09555 [Firmicutes bacterium]|nr:hypothetical protein [Bacillota bacterium]
MRRAFFYLAGFWLAASGAAGDQLRLRDGTILVGTIVGFEDHSFRVRTSYGYALVRKEMVVEILIREEPAAEPPPAPATLAPSPLPPSSKPAPAPQTALPPAAAPKTENSLPAAPKPNPAPAPPGPPALQPPEPIRFVVDGTSYRNLTFGFRLYKPPGWRIVEDAHELLPNAVAAMATADERTFLVIGREPLQGRLEEYVSRAWHALQRRYEQFRALGEMHLALESTPAIARRFRAEAEGHDWSAVVLWVAHNGQVFKLFGMTRADSELVQIQENVLARVLASLEFTKP